MTAEIKLPEFPKPDGTAEANCIPIRGSDGLVYREYDEVPAWSKPLVEELMREAVRLNAQAVPAAPQPAQQPLTESAIQQIGLDTPLHRLDGVIEFARAIEHAHGIGVKND